MPINNYEKDMKAIQDKKLRIIERDIRENTEYLKHAESTLQRIEKDTQTLLTAKEEAERKYEEISAYLTETTESIEKVRGDIARAEVEKDELEKKLARK